jgi:hypothetical protein
MIKKRKQITFDIDIETHTNVKMAATRRNISMNLWLNRAVLEKLKKEHTSENNDLLNLQN